MNTMGQKNRCNKSGKGTKPSNTLEFKEGRDGGRAVVDCLFRRVVGAEAEDVNFQDDGAGFALVEFAFRIFELPEGGAGTIADVAVFLELEGFAAGTGEGIEEAGEGGGIAAELTLQPAGTQIAQGIVDVQGAKLESALVYFVGVAIVQEVAGRFLADAAISQPVLVKEPVLMAALFPFRKVAGFELAGRQGAR